LEDETAYATLQEKSFPLTGDPLRSLFVSTAMAIGNAVRHPAFGPAGFWTVGVLPLHSTDD
jgi:hypothetical protein